MNIEFTKHALEEIQIRGIELDIVEKIIRNPKQVLESEKKQEGLPGYY